jgi:hypothetical protein
MKVVPAKQELNTNPMALLTENVTWHVNGHEKMAEAGQQGGRDQHDEGHGQPRIWK